MKIARECGMRIAETDQIQKRTYQRGIQPLAQFGARIVMTVDVPAHTGPPQQIQVIRSGQEPDVINLRYSRSKEVNGARDQIIIVPAAEGIIESAIDLIQIQVACGGSSGLPAFAVAPLVNRFDQVIDFLGSQQTERAVRTFSIGADIDYSDSVVCIEHGDGVAAV